MLRRPAVLAAALIVLLLGCAEGTEPGQVTQASEGAGTSDATATPQDVAPTADPSPSDAASTSAQQRHPDVVDAELTEDDDGTFTAAVTLSSPYDTPERYADAWRVLSPDREELGIRPLAHHHANEQPFTRSQAGIEIPADVTEVIVQGRDQANGWGGAELTIPVPGR